MLRAVIINKKKNPNCGPCFYLRKMIKMIKLDGEINNSVTERIQKCQSVIILVKQFINSSGHWRKLKFRESTRDFYFFLVRAPGHCSKRSIASCQGLLKSRIPCLGHRPHSALVLSLSSVTVLTMFKNNKFKNYVQLPFLTVCRSYLGTAAGSGPALHSTGGKAVKTTIIFNPKPEIICVTTVMGRAGALAGSETLILTGRDGGEDGMGGMQDFL